MTIDLERVTIDWTAFEDGAQQSLELIQALADDKTALRNLVLRIADDDRLLSMCEVHQHDEVADEVDIAAEDRRVHYLVLHDALERGIRLRLLEPAVGSFNPIHDHRYSFASILLSGSYRHSIYSPIPLALGQSSSWRCNQQDGTHEEFDLPSAPDFAGFAPAWVQDYRTGSSYAMHHSTLHTVTHGEPDTFSLMLRSEPQKRASVLAEPKSQTYWWKFSRTAEGDQHLSKTAMSKTQFFQMVARMEAAGVI